jgi:hypothetical protein
VANSYVFTPVMQSSLVGMTGVENSNIITMEGANVTILPVNNDASRNAVQAVRSAGLDKLNARYAASLFPGGSLGVGFTILDPAQVAILRPIVASGDVEIIARVVAYGDVEGGRVESKPFDYPITVCVGCLGLNLGPCSSFPTDFEADADPGALCFPGQDGRAQCCQQDNRLICPVQGTLVEAP